MHQYAVRIKQERLRNGFTQEQLAEQVGVTVGTVSRWEAGYNRPSPLYLVQLANTFKVSLQDLETDDTSSGASPDQPQNREAPSIDPVIPQVPALVGREPEQAILKRRLSTRSSAEISVLYGLPGIGKTALMASLALDEELLARYPDGVLWASLGSDPDYTAILTRWSVLLEITPPLPENQDDWIHILRRKVRHWRVLILLDDVRHRQDVQLLAIAGPRGAHVVTTRLPTLAASLSSNALPIHELDHKQSQSLLHHLAPSVAEHHTHALRSLLDAVGGHPLLLTLAGRYIQQQAQSGHPRRLIAALEYLKDACNRLMQPLEPEQGGQPSSFIDADETYCALLAGDLSSTRPSVVSLFAEAALHLTSQEREVLFALSMFPAKPESFSEEAALQVGACDVKTLDALMDSSLLQAQGQRYQLHPAVRDYASLGLACEEQAQEAATMRLLAYATALLERDGHEYASIEQEVVVLQAALDLAWQSQRHQEAFRLTEALTTSWITHRRWDHAEHYFTTALRAARQERTHPHHVIHALLGLGRCALAQHTMMRALSHYQEAVLTAREPDTDTEIRILTLIKLGAVYLRIAQHNAQESYAQEAKACCTEALEVLGRLSSPPRLSPMLQAFLPLLYEILGTVALEEEGTLAALNFYQQGAVVAEQLQIRDALCWLQVQQATVQMYRGEFAVSEPLLRRALVLATQEHLAPLINTIYARLLDVALLTHRLEDAHQILTEWAQIPFEGDNSQGNLFQERLMGEHAPHAARAWIALYRGRVTLVQQDLQTVRHYYEETLHLAHSLPENHELLRHLWHDQTIVAIEHEEMVEAFTCLGELQHLVHSSQDILWQAHVYYRRAQLLTRLNMPARGREDAMRSQAIFRKRDHLLGLQTLDAWLSQAWEEAQGGGPS